MSPDGVSPYGEEANGPAHGSMTGSAPSPDDASHRRESHGHRGGLHPSRRA